MALGEESSCCISLCAVQSIVKPITLPQTSSEIVRTMLRMSEVTTSSNAAYTQPLSSNEVSVWHSPWDADTYIWGPCLPSCLAPWTFA